MTEQKEMLPCPFCAGPSVLFVAESPDDAEAVRKGPFGTYLRVLVKCCYCGAAGAPVDGRVNDQGLPISVANSAIQKWNTRKIDLERAKPAQAKGMTIGIDLDATLRNGFLMYKPVPFNQG